jgi:hypothetical protein
MEIEQLLTKIARILDELEIPYIITGGMAVTVWGRPRFTADIDIIVELIEKNISSLAKKLLSIDKDVYVNKETMLDALTSKGEFNFIHPQSRLKVDFWIIKNDFNKQEIKRGILKNIENYKVKFVSPEDLILSKLLWYTDTDSTRQIEDIKSVLKISKVDMDYIKIWAERHSTINILENILKEIKDGRNQ